MSASIEKKATEEESEITLSKQTQLVVGVTISLFTIIMVIGLLELVGFVWERRLAQGEFGWTLVASRRMSLERVGDDKETDYYIYRPNREYNWQGNDVVINEHGLRDDPIILPKRADTFRILNLGDSVAFGWKVAHEEGYGERLVQMLNGAQDEVVYEVINAGVGGWNPKMERNFLLNEGLSYEPDMILYQFTAVNDMYGSGPSVTRNPDLFDWLRDNTYSWSFVSTELRFLSAGERGPGSIPALSPPNDEARYYPLTEDAPDWDRVWGQIMEMHQAAEAADIPFAIIIFPSAFQVNDSNHSDIPQRVLGQRAAEAGIDFIDLLPTYQQACNEAGPDACEGYRNFMFGDVWMHPTALGHQLAAEVLFEQWEYGPR